MKIEKSAAVLTIISIIAFVFVAMATAGNAWVQQEVQTKDSTVLLKRGLWKSCSENDCVSFTVTSG